MPDIVTLTDPQGHEIPLVRTQPNGGWSGSFHYDGGCGTIYYQWGPCRLCWSTHPILSGQDENQGVICLSTVPDENSCAYPYEGDLASFLALTPYPDPPATIVSCDTAAKITETYTLWWDILFSPFLPFGGRSSWRRGGCGCGPGDPFGYSHNPCPGLFPCPPSWIVFFGPIEPGP